MFDGVSEFICIAQVRRVARLRLEPGTHEDIPEQLTQLLWLISKDIALSIDLVRTRRAHAFMDVCCQLR